jgi:hypothetical protein
VGEGHVGGESGATRCLAQGDSAPPRSPASAPLLARPGRLVLVGWFSQLALVGVARVRTTFVDDLGSAPAAVIGTGFWIGEGSDAPEQGAFVTNKHNVDPRLVRDFGARWRTSRVEIELREITELDVSPPGRVHVSDEVQWCEVSNLAESLLADDDTVGAPDCAVIVAPKWLHAPAKFTVPLVLPKLATATELDAKFVVGDAVSFIGYPGDGESAWWDAERHFPISRPAWIASWPGASFSHRDIKTADTTLLSGLSFSGNSGSPVIAHAMAPEFTRVLGIMSGHYWERSDDPRSLLRHSGLSYMTRATSIHALLERARAAGYSAPVPYGGLECVRAPSHTV